MPSFTFHQVDVFSAVPLRGNPLAVVLAADTLTDAQMAAIANWTNLSETTFLLRPTNPAADYRVRIFTPSSELPFAGHPTIGSAHVWLAEGGAQQGQYLIQECGVGLVRLRADATRLAFAAPPLRRTGPVAPDLLARIATVLRIQPSAITAAQWIDNGPGWIGVLLPHRDHLLALQPDFAAMAELNIGVAAPWPNGPAAFEVRGFAPAAGINEDPVTGSLNAGLAQWFFAAGLAPAEDYIVAQGTALGRAGRVHIARHGADIWIGGDTTPVIAGTLTL